jgi:hypothetical protein
VAEAPAEVRFDEEELLAEARAATGLSDFGDPAFREGLRVLLETYDRGAGFDARGRRRFRRRVVQLLATRLRVEEAWKRHPEALAREIRSPVYLTGLPRTGTSALFNLLAADPAARPLRLWEGTFPDPAEGLAPGQEDPRYLAVKAYYDRVREKDPEFTRIHFASADTPEECVLLLAHAFCDVQMGIEVMIEPWASWFQRQDLRRAYAYYRDLLKLLDWQRPGERWLLKSPAHLWALDVLVELFPDACLVFTHRNPCEAIASACSLTHALMTERPALDPRALGPQVLEYYARSLERGLAARDRMDPRRFHDVDYRAFVADPLAAAKGIYAWFGLPLDAEVEAALAAHVRENPQGKHGAHAYDLATYGLTPARVRDRLAAYVERFGLPAE